MSTALATTLHWTRGADGDLIAATDSHELTAYPPSGTGRAFWFVTTPRRRRDRHRLRRHPRRRQGRRRPRRPRRSPTLGPVMATFSDDYDRLDYCDVDAADHLRPFLAHVLAGLSPADQVSFLGDLGRIAHQMRAERAAHPDVNGKAWIALETARLDGACEIPRGEREQVAALATAGLADLEPMAGRHNATLVTPKGEW